MDLRGEDDQQEAQNKQGVEGRVGHVRFLFFAFFQSSAVCSLGMRSEMSCIIGGMQEPKDDDVRETLLRGLDLQMKNTNRHHQINSSPTKEGYYILVIYSMYQHGIYKLHKLHTAVYTYGTYSTYTKVK